MVCYFWKYFTFLLILLGSRNLVSCQPGFLYSSCGGSGNYLKNSTYETNLNTLLSSLPSGVDDYGFNSSSFGRSSDVVNAIALCRGDVNFSTCRDCVHNASLKITQTCPNKTEAIGGYDYCMVRYSNENIHGILDSTPIYYAWNLNNVSSEEQFSNDLGILFSGLRDNASKGGDRKKFASSSMIGPDVLTIYGVMQCSPDLSSENCNKCLNEVTNGISVYCIGRKGCKVIARSCNLRYEIYPFINSTPQDTPPPPVEGTGKDGGTSTTTIIVVVTSTVGFVVALIFCVIIFLKRRRHKKPRQMVETAEDYSSIDDMSNADSLQYDFGKISEATNAFSHVNKLGQGGFGAVYKGRLQNGQEVAVKRLSPNSGQGEHEFKNEVMLVAKLQHRNLVRLLGFSLEGTERLLIYEFVANSSLDQFIFDPIKRVILDWDKRYKIIVGIAKGLLYLHEDSRLRIIHRDLKASNVLLDNEMLPKIADFGMARLFVMDETQGRTNRIVGTYGYMSPEYAMHGHFSVKSDVFSFGVLILEILTGQKNSNFRNGENLEDLLSNVWKSWREGRAASLIDPTLLSGSSSTREMMRCIHMGLLCVQENATDRPSMASIVLMLSSSSLSLPLPLRPAFFPQEDMSKMTDTLSESRSTSTHLSQHEASITELYPR